MSNKLPKMTDLRSAIASAVMSAGEYDISAVDYAGPGDMVVRGETLAGVGFSFSLTIDDLEEDGW